MGPMAAALPFIIAGADVIQGIGASVSDAYQAKVAANNAVIAKQYSKWAEQEGDIDSTTSGLKTKAEIGQTRAGFAGAGVDVNTGSAANVQAAEGELGRFDAMTIRSNAARQAYGEDIKGAGFTANSVMLKQKSFLDPIAGLASGASALAGGIQNPFPSTSASVSSQAVADSTTGKNLLFGGNGP